MSIFTSLFAFFIVLSVVVFVHELGHYLVAKISGVKIVSFSIGMGKELWGWNDRSGTRWKISALPFGGYVQMLGDEDAASTKQNKDELSKLSESEKKQTFLYQSAGRRMLIIAAGPFFNFLLAIIIFTAALRINGYQTFSNRVDEVFPDSPAMLAGIEVGDKISSINGIVVENFGDISSAVSTNKDDAMEITVDRNGKILSFKITPVTEKSQDVFGNEIDRDMIGIASKTPIFRKLNIFQAFGQAVENTYRISMDTLRALGQMITGQRGFSDLGGPIKIAKYSGQSLNIGFGALIGLIALISINLGLMNLLPIPVLDGGHLFFYLIEILIRRPIPEKIQNALLSAGLGLLIFIMVFATVNDILSF